MRTSKGGYIDSLNVKKGTRFNLDLARRNFVEFFGADKPLRAISTGDADDWRRWLQRPVKEGGRGLDVNTVRRHCGRAKQFFRAAARKKLIPESPFGDMKDTKVNGNKDRFYFVTTDEAAKVLAQCPDTQTKLLFALCRFGGLRYPSEPTWLRWDEVDWERGRFKVHSPKTEHCEGHESREVPIFPELRPYLEAAYAERGDSEYVVTIPSVVRFREGGPNPNLGTRMAKIVRRAGLKPWPKLFQNLRATRQNELERQFPTHVVCQWLGNTQAVAREHYLRVTEEDFAEAASCAEGCAASPEERMRQGCTDEVAASRQLLQIVENALKKSKLKQHAASVGKFLQDY